MDRASRKTLLFLKTTFSGVTVKVSLSVAKFDRFEDLEDRLWTIWSQLLTLKCLGASSTFCKLLDRLHVRESAKPG